MNIFFIGLPGSGKSTLGREVALAMKLKFVDTDAEIVGMEGREIEEIFKFSGEDYFRKLEQSLLYKISEANRQLISTGGGTPCFFDNLSYMNNNGITVFIDVPVEALHQRLIGQRVQKRPMLEGKTDEEVLLFLKQKYEERIPFYSKALIRVSGSNILATEILAELERIKNTF